MRRPISVRARPNASHFAGENGLMNVPTMSADHERVHHGHRIHPRWAGDLKHHRQRPEGAGVGRADQLDRQHREPHELHLDQRSPELGPLEPRDRGGAAERAGSGQHVGDVGAGNNRGQGLGGAVGRARNV